MWRTYDRLAIDLTTILGEILRYFVSLAPGGIYQEGHIIGVVISALVD